MSSIPTDSELGLPEGATPTQRAKKIAELGGFKGLGSATAVQRASTRNMDGQPNPNDPD